MRNEREQVGIASGVPGQPLERHDTFSTFAGLVVSVGLGLTLWLGILLLWWAL